MLNHYARMLSHLASYLEVANDKAWYVNQIEKTSKWLWEVK